MRDSRESAEEEERIAYQRMVSEGKGKQPLSELTDRPSNRVQEVLRVVSLHPRPVNVAIHLDTGLSGLVLLSETHADLAVSERAGSDGENKVEQGSSLAAVKNVECIGRGGRGLGSGDQGLVIDSEALAVLSEKEWSAWFMLQTSSIASRRLTLTWRVDSLAICRAMVEKAAMSAMSVVFEAANACARP
jgi:hypothetical protein